MKAEGAFDIFKDEAIESLHGTAPLEPRALQEMPPEQPFSS